MQDNATLILAIIGAVIIWTSSVVALVAWLHIKFDYLKSTIYREMDKHRREDDANFREHRARLYRLELKEFGFGGIPVLPPQRNEDPS